jgi:hypothetical protein
VTLPSPPGPLAPPPSPSDFSGFCDPPECVLHAVAPHPGGGFAVFREVFPPGAPRDRGEGVTEFVAADGTVRRIARGVIVLQGEFDAHGNLRALVEPQWDHAAGALDVSVTRGPAVAGFTASGEVAWVQPLATAEADAR